MADRFGVMEEVYQIILDRQKNPRDGAYTSYLLSRGEDKICKKVIEEATELVLAAKNDDPEKTLAELADLHYHLLVLMVQESISLDQLEEEMEKRRS